MNDAICHVLFALNKHRVQALRQGCQAAASGLQSLNHSPTATRDTCLLLDGQATGMCLHVAEELFKACCSQQ